MVYRSITLLFRSAIKDGCGICQGNGSSCIDIAEILYSYTTLAGMTVRDCDLTKRPNSDGKLATELTDTGSDDKIGHVTGKHRFR